MMAHGYQVLEMLVPNSVWSISGNDWSGVEFDGKAPITQTQFEAGFAEYDAWKAQQEATKAEAKAALLDRLGITEAEARLLLG